MSLFEMRAWPFSHFRENSQKYLLINYSKIAQKYSTLLQPQIVQLRECQ